MFSVLFREIDPLFSKWGAVSTSVVTGLLFFIGLVNGIGCLSLFLLPALLFGLIGYIKIKDDMDEVKSQKQQIFMGGGAEPASYYSIEPASFGSFEPPRTSPESVGLFVPDPINKV